MKTLKIAGLSVLLVLACFLSLPAQEDEAGSKDHPLFTRMPGYYISSYSQADFDSFEFDDQNGEPVAVEGKKTYINYELKDGAKVASPLQIARNYQNALTKIGGTVIFQEIVTGGGRTSMKLVQGTDEIWVKVWIGDSGYNYSINIIEKGAMKQDITANADTWKSDINTTGHAAIYGIYFDTDKAVLKPESEPAILEIVKLLTQNPSLTVYVVGHTDSKGDILHNMTLSEARAKAVFTDLTTKRGIAASRLAAYGCGPLSPVASNDTEEGRAKNRRVELVKR
jgi:OmpA-OmpF porin, OOP family